MTWLLDFLQLKGYAIDLASSEEAGEKILEDVKSGKRDYALAIFDIMVVKKDIMEIDDLDDAFYQGSYDAGIRLCRYARRALGITPAQLPIICISGRDDDELRKSLTELDIPIFGRSDPSLRGFLRDSLPS